jgi:hypothetical protein
MAIATIRTIAGPREIAVEMVSGFAVHLEFEGSRWTITHLPTGATFPFRFDKFSDAEISAKSIADVAPSVDWTSPTAADRASKTAKDALIAMFEKNGGVRTNGPRLKDHPSLTVVK